MTADPLLLAPEVAVAAPAPAPPPRPSFGAAKAFASFAILLGAQFLAGAGVMVLATFVSLARGLDPSSAAFTATVTKQILGPLLIAAGVVSTIVAWLVARLWAWDLVFDRSPAGVGLTPASRQQLVLWSAAGALSAALYLGVANWVVPFDPTTPVGPLVQAATAGGATRIAWAALALLFAPLVEEFFFRGLLLRGFTASWGPIAGGTVVTALFILVHLSETYRYWPATMAITLMGLITLAARKITGSLWPGVVLHFAYNLVVVLAVFFGMS